MWKTRRKKLSNRPRGRIKRRRQSGAPWLLLLMVLFILSSLTAVGILLSHHSNHSTNPSTPSLLRRANTSSKKTAESSSSSFDDDDSSNNTVEEWPLLHIVNTRFMQEQGHLVELAQARLKLLETFCLPTLVHQTTQRFIWIIKTDPLLHQKVRNELIALLEPFDHFYLVASNNNFGIEGGSWRDGSEGSDILSSTIYTGNVATLQQTHELRTTKPILETRLDADDGLHKLYLQYIQYSASKHLQNKKWLYWCSRRHLEWYVSPFKQEGMVNPVEHEKLCITPGITVGYNLNVLQVPQYDHNVLYKEIQAHGGCHDNDDNQQYEKEKNMDCIQLVDDLSFVAVRSRTPTSAGMMDISLKKEILDKEGINMVWKALDKLFFISKPQATETNKYVLQHLPAIAKDNLEGQCTKGHSCKNSSIVLLQNLVQNGTAV